MAKIRFPKPPTTLPIHEMNMIVGGKAQGMTYKEIKAGVDASRKMSGTYKGKGISTNTVSRLLGPTHGLKYRKDVTHTWNKYEGRKRQHNVWQETRKKITDKDSLKRFDKMMKRIVEGSRGEQYRLRPKYEAETDEYVVESW